MAVAEKINGRLSLGGLSERDVRGDTWTLAAAWPMRSASPLKTFTDRFWCFLTNLNMNNHATPEPKLTLEDKALRYIANNNGKCWAFVGLVCAVGVMWRNSWL